MEMAILKVSVVRKIFHDAGVKRISSKSVDAIDDAVTNAIMTMAQDIGKLFPGKLIESNDVARLCSVATDKYRIDVVATSTDDIDMEHIVREEPLPDFDDNDDDDADPRTAARDDDDE